MFDAARGDSLAMLICSLLSLIVTIPVLLVPYLFPRMAKKQYVVVVFYISLSTFVSAIATSFGMPYDGSIECYFQAVVQNIMTVSSAFWTVILSVQLYFIVELGSVFIITWEIHVVIWLLSLLVTLLPLSQVSYGARNGLGWCFIVDAADAPAYRLIMWYWLAYYLWMWISILTFILFSVLTQKSAAAARKNISSKAIKVIDPLQSAFRILQPYPYLLILSWSLTTVADSFEVTLGESSVPPGLVSAGNALGCLQGFLISTYYLVSNVEVQNAYCLLLFGVPRRKLSLVSRVEKVAAAADDEGKGNGQKGTSDLDQSVVSEYLVDGSDDEDTLGSSIRYANIRNFQAILRTTYLVGRVEAQQLPGTIDPL